MYILYIYTLYVIIYRYIELSVKYFSIDFQIGKLLAPTKMSSITVLDRNVSSLWYIIYYIMVI